MTNNKNVKALALAILMIASVGSTAFATMAYATTTNEDEDKKEDKATPRNSDRAEEKANSDHSAVVAKDNNEDDDNSEEDTTTTTTETTKSAAVSTLSTANTDTLVPEYQRFVLTTTRTPTAEQNMLNNNVGTGNALDPDPGDQLVFHYGSGQAPTQAQIDMLKAIDGITDNNIGFEFFSLAEIQQYAPVVAQNGFGFISYDLEAGASPSNETSNPVAAFQSAKAAADAAGIELQATPSRAITAANGAQIAPLVSLYHIQSQSLQDADTTCATMKNFVVEREQALRSANSNLNGKISFQVSFTAGAATGKTAYQTIVDCATATIPTAEDGISVWWNGAAFDNTGTDGLKAFYTFVENGYSRNNPN